MEDEDEPASASTEALRRGGAAAGSSEAAAAERRRNYTAFPGKNKFACDGRIMQGPDRAMLGCTVLLIAVPAVLFSVFETSLPWLTQNLSPAVAAFFAVILAFMLGSLLATSFRDPGVLPRGPPRPSPKPVEDADELPANYPLGMGPLPPLVIHEFTVNGKVVKTRYCDTCEFPRPPRVHHCRTCNCCVDCPWVANCVGRRNHRSFVTFVVSATLLALYVSAFALYHFAVVASAFASEDAGEKIVHALSEAPTSIFLAGFCLLMSCSVGGLSGMHCTFACTNDTTNESMKRMSPMEPSVFSEGFWRNLARFFCGPQPASYIDRRGWIASGRDGVARIV